MKILFLSFYFPPDLSAGSFRAAAVTAALRERAPPGTQIDVLTTVPNRYHSFTQAAPAIETAAGLRVQRLALPVHRGDMFGQSRAFASFARQVLHASAGHDYDVVLATSSRLMTAALGAWVARHKRARLYLDIRDLFVDTIGDVLPPLAAGLTRHSFSLVESWTMRRADRINLVSPGFAEYFRTRYADRSLTWFTNGIDDEFLAQAPGAARREPHGAPVTVLYAGNIGDGQALHEILPGLAHALRGLARFIVIGDGGRRGALAAAIARAAVDNVEIRAPVRRAELLEAYRAADVLFLHLRARAAFERVLPSKIFEYGALGKPVLAGVAGYAARFIHEELTNAAVFPPGDVAQAIAALQSLEVRDHPRPDFVAKFSRAGIARAMADDVLALAHSS